MKLRLLILLLLSSNLVFAQKTKGDFVNTSNAKESLRIAQGFIRSKKLDKAERQLRHTIKIKEDFAIAHRILGKVYLDLAKYDKAKEAFEASFELDEKLSRAAFFECAETYFQTGDVDVAIYYYERYKDMKGSRYANAKKESALEFTYDKKLPERQKNCKYVQRIDTSKVTHKPINLGKEINSKYDEYLPTVTIDGDNLVYTRQADNEDIFISKWNSGWGKGNSFGSAINTDKNEGMAKFEAHGKAFYFAGCQREDTEGGCDIYQAILKDDEVVDVFRLQGNLNSTNWDSQPSITCDGKTMYFCSSRKEGLGGSDIWVSHLLANGEWSLPENLGNVINTEGDEEAPFISSDGTTLYFTSTGHPGQGDGDLFISRNIMGIWTSPNNLGYPVNSTAKEIGIYVHSNSSTAYFASSRNGGNGGLDIYEVELPEQYRPDPIVHIEGSVFDYSTYDPIATTVKIGRDNKSWTVESDENGWFYLCLPGNKGYSFQVEHRGYEYYVNAAFIENADFSKPVKVDIPLVPTQTLTAKTPNSVPKVKEKRIQFFFDFDSYKLNEATQYDLKELVELLKKEEGWKVEVVGYADSSGSIDYNKKLSEKRALSIVDFLTRSGVTVDKVLKSEGKGSITSSDEKQARRVDVVLRR